MVGLVIFAALDLSFKICEVLFFVTFDSAFNNFSSLPVKVIPGLIMETETLSIFPCNAKLLEKWFKAEFTAPPIINVRNGFSQAPAPPPILIILPLLSFLFGGVDASVEVPVIKQLSQSGFTYEGGIKLPPELISLALALSLYTATFIAECVRAGVQGVSKGQKEAAASIGLTPNQVLKLVVMPQALRIIIPPTTNQYLNLTKNSSLAAAIAYPDLVLVFAGTALMQTGRAIEIVSITMLTYLSLSISISVFMLSLIHI